MKTMKSYQITVGLGNSSENTLITRSALLRTRSLELFGGFTVLHGDGGWRDPSGITVTEPVCIITVVSMSRAKVTEFAAFACRLYAQDCVLLVLPGGDCKFVKA